MAFFALVLTLLAEQLRPLPLKNFVYGGMRAVVDDAPLRLNAGRAIHGVYAWFLVVGLPALAAGLVYVLCWQIHFAVALMFNVIVLYFCLGFRQFSHHVTTIQLALESNDLNRARQTLSLWKQAEDPGYSAADLDQTELLRQTIEHGLQRAHRQVYGSLFWFVLLPGPVGPILYRLADYAARRWQPVLVPTQSGQSPPDRFGDFAVRAFAWIDWIPARLTALGFAIVGDFEGAIYCWRQLAARTQDVSGLPGPSTRNLILAAASGALGCNLFHVNDSARSLGSAVFENAGLQEPDVMSLRAGIGLVWRALLLWLLLLLIMTLVAWTTGSL